MSKRKAPSKDNNPNHDFCEFLIELSDYEKNVNRNIYKHNAYRKAAQTLASLPTRIKSGEDARKLNGIGEKIAAKIDEFLETGKLRKLDVIRADESGSTINSLTRISGIGPAKAQELVRAGVKSIDDLHKYKDKLNHHQLIGLRYFEDFEKRIPREEIEEIEKFVKKEIGELDSDYKIAICGSYRRKKPTSGDVDILLTHPDFSSKDSHKTKAHLLHEVVKVLESKNLITDTISLGDTKFMGVCKLPKKVDGPYRRLDIRLAPHDQYYCNILYFTGSDLFNRRMRAHAQEHGFTLNEYSLRKLNSAVPEEITSEKHIFDILKFPYKEPEDRDE